jgi:hypothetical protein
MLSEVCDGLLITSIHGSCRRNFFDHFGAPYMITVSDDLKFDYEQVPFVPFTITVSDVLLIMSIRGSYRGKKFPTISVHHLRSPKAMFF